MTKRQKVIISAMSIMTLIFLSAYLSIFYTSHTTLFKVRANLNDTSSPTIRAYYNNLLQTEPNVQYTIKAKITGIGAVMYMYDLVDTQYSYKLGYCLSDGSSNPKSISVDFTGLIDRIAISTWTDIHIIFTLEVRITYYEIDWIYSTLIATYVIICVVLGILLGKYSEKDNFIKRVFSSFKSKNA